MPIRKSISAAGGVFAVCLFSAVPVCAQESSSQHMDTGAKKMMSSGDTTFAMKAAQGGMAEVKLGQLAVDKAGNADVKQFGQKMVDDHTKLNDQMKQVASAQNMTLPTPACSANRICRCCWRERHRSP